MKVYVVRHGQTEWNVQKKVMGRFDAPLTEVGLEQAKEVSNKLKYIDIDLIICSPLKRAKQTAKVINKNKNISIIYDDRLIERYFGNLEGVLIDSINFNEYWDYYKNLDDNNVETMHKMFKRIYNFLDDIKEKYKNKNVLLVTHGGVGMSINCYFQNNIPKGSLRELGFQLKNCELKEYEI